MRRIARTTASCLALLALTGSSALAQPAPAPATGQRIFLEGGLAYGYQLSNWSFIEGNNGTRVDTPSNSGPAVDLAGGLAIVPRLFVMGDVQYASRRHG